MKNKTIYQAAKDSYDRDHPNPPTAKELLAYVNKQKQHGGKRKGAGRPKLKDSEKKEPTKPVRIPISWIDKVKAFIKSN